MKKNLGTIDKGIRLLAAILIVLLYANNVLSGIWAILFMALALIFLLTALFSFCPLYLPFGIHTNKKKKA